jgi:hypothetical protein
MSVTSVLYFLVSHFKNVWLAWVVFALHASDDPVAGCHNQLANQPGCILSSAVFIAMYG